MRQGTTPTHIFHTSMSLSEAEVIYITYEQGGETVVDKSIEDMTVTDEMVQVTLTQEETLAFNLRDAVRIQIRARFADGTAVACQVIETLAEEVLKEGVI